MVNFQIPSDVRRKGGATFFGKGSLVTLLVLLAFFLLCLVVSWTTRGAMAHLSFPQGPTSEASMGHALVDTSPWLTAQALAPLAESAEERRYARDAERLADHDVDQAFAAALRTAAMQNQHRTLTGNAMALAQKIAMLQQLIKNDQAQVNLLSSNAKGPATAGTKDEPPGSDSDDLQVAKAQLGLDSDELTDAQRDLERESGDQSVQINGELAAHEASMRQYDSQAQQEGLTAALNEKQNTTLASQLKAWFGERERSRLIKQALQQSQSLIATLTGEHNALEAKANASEEAAQPGGPARSARLENLQESSAERQILSIDDDRIQTEKQLASVYGNWEAQLALQHQVELHKMMLSMALIAVIIIGVLLCDIAVRYFMVQPALEKAQLTTLRNVLELAIQVVGLLLILLVIFGTPRQMPTMVGLATAGLTIALQDFLLAFLGWFVLMGKHGIRVGDWVEINGVGGEVTQVGLFYTTLLETGNLADKGIPTGRRIRLINSFAIRGQYFNFSTAGQWMWDEITVNIPEAGSVDALIERIQESVMEETEENAGAAEKEWRSGAPGGSLSRYSTKPTVNMRPAASGIDVHVRYVTRASGRIEMRNRLYHRVLELLRAQTQAPGK